jgi:hypothetical protein
MDQNRHKVKRQRVKKKKKKLESSPRLNKQNLHHQHWPHGQENSFPPPNSTLVLDMTAKS